MSDRTTEEAQKPARDAIALAEALVQRAGELAVDNSGNLPTTVLLGQAVTHALLAIAEATLAGNAIAEARTDLIGDMLVQVADAAEHLEKVADEMEHGRLDVEEVAQAQRIIDQGRGVAASSTATDSGYSPAT